MPKNFSIFINKLLSGHVFLSFLGFSFWASIFARKIYAFSIFCMIKLIKHYDVWETNYQFYLGLGNSYWERAFDILVLNF